MSSEYIYFILQSQQYPILKTNFLALSKLPEQKRNIKKSILPEWVTPSAFNKIKQFIESQDLSAIDTSNNQEVQKLLALGEFLCLEVFQERFIQEKLLNVINPNNCVMLLIQAHKKLRNSDKSLTCWYNLLNASMSYIANNILLLYPKIKEEMKKLNEKILSQILERTIKILRKNSYQDKDEIFRIIVEIKGTEDVGKICQQLKQIVKKKKINPQIHANLSWKLKDLINIDLKKTKVFKFIDYQWKLQALASTQNNKRQLNISLVLESARDGSQKSSSSAQSQNLDDFHLNSDTVSGFNQHRRQPFGQNDFQRIGVLYLKLVSKIEENTYQTDVRVNYLNIEEKQSIQLLQFSETQLQQLGPKRIEITLYCSLENVYTFILNYVLEKYQLTSINLQHFCFEELAQIAHFYTKDGKQVQALHIILHLLHSKKCSQMQIRGLVLGLDYRILPIKALISVSDLLKLVGFFKLNQQLMTPFGNQPSFQPNSSLNPSPVFTHPTLPFQREDKRDKIEISRQQPYVLQRASTSQNLRTNQNKIPLENKMPVQSHSQNDLGIKNRADSKQRLKKIFESPKRRGPLTIQQQKQQDKLRIDNELDIKKYIYLQDSAFCKSFIQ